MITKIFFKKPNAPRHKALVSRVALCVIAALCSVLTSCSDSESNDVTYGKTGSGTVLTLTHEGQAVSDLKVSMGELSSYIISVNTDGGWVVSMPDADTTWVHITPTEGYGWNVTDEAAKNNNAHVRLKVDYNSGAPRQTALTFTTGTLKAVLNISQSGRGSSNDPIETSWEMVAKLKIGYNLGNTLESNHDLSNSWFNPSGPGDWQTYETCWGQPVTTQAIINALADRGFNIIRVPVTWFPHMDEEGNINKEWMDRVEEVVNYVLNAGCYCILNVHHDNGERGEGRTDRHAWLTADMDKYAENTKLLQKIWQQICERFRDYDGRLLFESFNEILDKNYSWTPPTDVNSSVYECINKLQQDFVNVVRASGGNNLYRNLAVTTYAATGNKDVPVEAFQAPQDQVDGHLYLSIHSYDPYNFVHDNSGVNEDGSTYDYNIKIFNDECREVIDGVFARCNKRAMECGMPFIFGEFGAGDTKKALAERVKYANYMNQKFKEYKMAGLVWMGFYDRKTNEWSETEVLDALMK